MTTNQIIYSTKKLQEEHRNQLSKNQFTIVDRDFISIQSKSFSVDTVYDYLIFTSQNTVNQIITHPSFSKIKHKPVLCVGQKTKERLQEHSFTIIESANNAEELVAIIDQKYTTSSFTFFCGESRLNILPDYFTENKINWNEYQVYTTALTPHKITENPDALLFFSPSGVQSYLQNNTITNEVCFCIGKTTAQSLHKTTQNVQIAMLSTVNGVITECIKYYRKYD